MHGNRIRNIPVIIALVMGIFVGTISYLNGFEYHIVYLRTIAAIVIFYVLGIIARKTVRSVIESYKENIALKPEKGANVDLVADDAGDDELA
jgi:hypothetical protein